MEKEHLQADLRELSLVLSGNLYFDSSPKHQAILRAYSTDASVYQEMPVAVAIPKSQEDLKQLIIFAGSKKVTLIPRTAGTSLAGQVVGSGLVVDFSKHFNRILEINPEERWVRVESGVIRDDLNKILRPYGLMFGPETSTASRAMIGGMIGNNSSGLHSIVWGDTRAHLLSAKALLDDASEMVFERVASSQLPEKTQQPGREGEIYRKLQNLLSDPEHQQAIAAGYPKKTITRRNTGYALDLLIDQKDHLDLCAILAGSEGTLAMITEAKINLIPLPLPEVGLLCVHCHSIQQALEANIIALQHHPEASELVDKYILDFTKGHPTYQYNRFFIEGDPESLLMVEFRGNSLEEVEAKAEALRQALQQVQVGYAFPLVTGTKETNLVWDVRKAGLGLIRNLPGDTQPVNLIEDCAVSPADLPGYVEDLQVILKKYDLKASYYAHAGAGELHIEPLINLKTEAGKIAFRGVLSETAQLINQYQGSLSGEHGDGRLRGEFIETVLGTPVYNLLKHVKETFDPQGIFNKGKIVDAPPMDEFLRYKQDMPLATTKIDTIFDFTYQEGILRLSEKCSGSGDCRKTHLTGGTMCPSYMATREEKDTTRARANMLRQFLTDSTQANRFDHPELKEIMDLCLSCKACKSECPSGVDIAKMKAEFLQHYYDANGVPFRSWVIGNFTKSQQIASLVPGVYNWMINQPILASLIKKSVGFAQRRSLPAVGKTRLSTWIRKQQSSGSKTLPDADQKRRVILFCDEFTEFNDVGIGQKAFQLLRALGYQVDIARHLESGRTYLSKGLVRKAQKIARENVRKLKDLISDDVPLIGIEPSAILTFRDEYPDLVTQDLRADAHALGRNALLIDEFIFREMEAGRIRQEHFDPVEQKIKLHGHCYQKAFHLVETTRKILSFPKGYEVEVIPSGCCGMAGSFGYEKEHFDVSMQVGELVLLPTVRETPAAVLIAAPGTSCRHQIKDGAQRHAYHPIEILWDALSKRQILQEDGNKIKKSQRRRSF